MLSNLNKFQIVLASQSPRRKHLLEGLGMTFDTVSVDADETVPENMVKEDVALYLSRKKFETYLQKFSLEDKLVITADTIVCLENRIINKPEDRNHAIEMLSDLSGKMHEVITGVTVGCTSKVVSFYDLSRVFFNELTQREIEYYIDNYSPYDKAGSYGIQEWIGYVSIKNIEGSYFNVMGLPTQKLYNVLKDF